MTLKSLHKPVIMTFGIAALAAFAITLMPRSAEAAPVVRSYRVVPGYTVPGYKRPFLFTPGYRPYTLIFKHLR